MYNRANRTIKNSRLFDINKSDIIRTKNIIFLVLNIIL